MNRVKTRTRAGLAGLLAASALLAVVGCGGGKDGGGEGAGDTGQDTAGGPDAGEGAASDAELDVCVLLEVAEIDEQFGEYGAVSEGRPSAVGAVDNPTGSKCSWDVGDPTTPQSVTVVLSATRTFSPAVFDELTGDPVDGLGDEALVDGQTLHVRSGEAYFNVGVGIGDSDPVTSDKLVTLGRAIVPRL